MFRPGRDRRQLGLEDVDIDVGRGQDDGVDPLQHIRPAGQGELAQRFHRHQRPHGMSDQIDANRLSVGEQDEGLHQSVAGELRTVTIIEIGRELAGRRPGIVHEGGLQTEIIDDLGVQVEPVGKRRVETVHEEEDVALGEGQGDERVVQLAGEIGLAVIVLPAGQGELGVRIGAAGRIVDLAGQAIVRHPDTGAGKAQLGRTLDPEMVGRVFGGLARRRDEDGVRGARGLSRIQHGQAGRRGGTSRGQDRKAQDERVEQSASHGFPLLAPILVRRCGV